MASHSHDEETPLHIAARFGVPELLVLYLSHGASVDVVNSTQETPLMTAAFWAFDSKEQTYSPDHHLVCRLLLDHQAGEFLDCLYMDFTFFTHCFAPLRLRGFVFYNIALLFQIQTFKRRTTKRLFTRQPGTAITS